MSTLKATNLQHASAASPNIVLDANGNATMAGTMAMATPFAMRNKIINGAMEIDQRNAGAAFTVNNGGGNYALDRWQGSASGGGIFTIQRSTVVPDGTFTNSMAVTVTTADTSVAASDYYTIQHYIEGYNVADLAAGKSDAKTFTVSFRVRSSVTGSYTATIMSSDGQRAYRQLFTINSANTYQTVSLTFPGDTSGTWYTDNRIGMMLFICLGSGSSFTGATGSWAAGNYVFAGTGQTNWISTNGATFYLTGVQLEVGSVATPFERRLYGQELALCQRYWVRTSFSSSGYTSGSASVGSIAYFPVSMRAAPSVSAINVTGAGAYPASGTYTGTTYGVAFGGVAGGAYIWNGDLLCSAEL